MPETGHTLSHFKIVEKIGAGGMGTVYLADDTTLDRKVALKFLPEAFTSDPERMARFEREAKLLASLNHPNIAGIHGLEQADGNRFLVLEYVEGETLQARLSKGALPLEDALELCRQIAEGLEAAHEKGVIHRDLKPANVMITADEKVKILDFGLAKAFSDDTQSIDSSQSPTLTEAMTQPGVILGTAAYMSPEQAKGKSVDKRADIWAYGCILYECLTGKKAFEGETVTETLAAVIRGEPDWNVLPTTTPQNIRFALHWCLEKDIIRRFRDAADIRIQIEGAPDIGEKKEPIKRHYPRLSWTWVTAAALMVLVLVIIYFRGTESPETVHLHLSVPTMPSRDNMAISPDGRWIAYVASTSNTAPSLFVHGINSGSLLKIDGTEGASGPFWSPDSQWIAFWVGGSIKKVDVSGRRLQGICAAPDFHGGTWNRQGIILFSDRMGPLRQVSENGGEAVEITALDESQGEGAHIYPFFLPDGRHYLYTTLCDPTSNNGIYIGLLDSQERTKLLNVWSNATYVDPGYLLYHRERMLYARSFDVKNLSLTGEEVLVADNLFYDFNYNPASFGASQNGILVYLASEVKSQLVWFDRNGNELGTVGNPDMYMPGFDLSPDGERIAMPMLDMTTRNFDIYLMDLTRKNIKEGFTYERFVDDYPRWSFDGKQIIFASYRNENADIFIKNTSGTGEETLLFGTPENEYPNDWSMDGRYIVYLKQTISSYGIYILPLFGDKEPFPIAKSSGNQWNAQFSFDNTMLAYQSNETGTTKIYVVSFPEADDKRTISDNGGVQPRWRKDGKELYYLSLDGKLMAVNITSDTKIDSDFPRVLFDTALSVRGDVRQYEVTPDGERFLFLKPLAENSPAPISVVLNWTKLLENK